MSRLSVVIPSRNSANLIPCVAAIRKHEPEARIIVVDDGITGVQWETFLMYGPNCADYLRIVTGVKPFVFARNCNIGIRAAGDDYVILLNDDALLTSRGGFSLMQRAARDFPEYGVISATTNHAGNPAQIRMQDSGLRRCGVTPGNSFPVVAFVCVLIPRRTIRLVGRLDERFTGYGWEDNDYCRRVTQKGLLVGIHDGCFVDHASLRSTFRGLPQAAGDIEPGRKIYLDKWGSM